MSTSQNVIHDMNLNIEFENPAHPIVSESELYGFANGPFIECIDEILDGIHIEGDVELDSLSVDLELDGEGDIFLRILDGLRDSLRSKLDTAVFKAKSDPVTSMLANVYRQYLPMEKSSNIERALDSFLEKWKAEHDCEMFNSLGFSEMVLRKIQAEFPHLDWQQIACVVYQKILQMKNSSKPQKSDNLASLKNAETVADSGLVLISPYLPPLFERTCCTEKGTFISEASQKKSLAVLKYAAFGNYKEPPGNAAVMNLLCGLPVTPVYYADELPGLSDSEKELVDSLLKAVIANWKVVGNMSPDGLRGSYFVRPGIIETTGAADVLSVEKKTYDILIDKLPWSYSMIKHPWMKKMLNVKWR